MVEGTTTRQGAIGAVTEKYKKHLGSRGNKVKFKLVRVWNTIERILDSILKTTFPVQTFQHIIKTLSHSYTIIATIYHSDYCISKLCKRRITH